MKFKLGDEVLLTDECLNWYRSALAMNSHKIGGAGGYYDDKGLKEVRDMLFDMSNMYHFRQTARVVRDLQNGNYRVNFGSYETNIGKEDLILVKSNFDRDNALSNAISALNSMSDEQLEEALGVLGVK